MRLGVRRQAGWGVLILLGLVGSGCATAGAGGGATKDATKASALDAQAPASPTCPVSLLLGAEPGASEPKPGPWLQGLSTADLEPGADATRESFRQRLELASGPLEVVGLELNIHGSQSGGVRVALARPESGGYCVPNQWTTWLSARIGLSLAGSWTSADQRMALLLLKLETTQEGGAPETRWVVLGTDGANAWFALGSPEQHQLIVPSVAFFTQGKSVYLDIKQRYLTRLALGKDGRFIQPAPH